MRIIISVLVGLVAAVLIGCSQQAPRSSEGLGAKSDQSPASAQQLLAAYEGLRSRLANDQEVSAAEFERVAEAARETATSYSGAAAAHLERLASAADEGAGRASLDLVAAREAFGEVSRHVVSWVAGHPELANGRYVFECPMAKGYRKWVQQSESVPNPYMGQEMAACGSASKWLP